jgi:hypothetical protein
MYSWKRIVVTAVAAGAGIALSLSLVGGVFAWYKSRPKRPTPWNNSAITAVFDYVDYEGEDETLLFHYVLENTTNSDYQLLDGSELTVMAKLRRENSLSFDKTTLRVDLPILIPARQRLLVDLHLAYRYTGPVKFTSESTPELKNANRMALAEFVKNKLTNLTGFVILDESHRYQINLPQGW